MGDASAYGAPLVCEATACGVRDVATATYGVKWAQWARWSTTATVGGTAIGTGILSGRGSSRCACSAAAAGWNARASDRRKSEATASGKSKRTGIARASPGRASRARCGHGLGAAESATRGLSTRISLETAQSRTAPEMGCASELDLESITVRREKCGDEWTAPKRASNNQQRSLCGFSTCHYWPCCKLGNSRAPSYG